MQGIWVQWARVKTKKDAIKAIKNEPETVSLQATSFFGNEYDGPILNMPKNQPAHVVGPDPERQRNWYLTIERLDKGFRVE